MTIHTIPTTTAAYLTERGRWALIDRNPCQAWEEIGPTLYGAEWKLAMAAALGCNERSVRRWADGSRRTPDDIWPRLRALLLERSVLAKDMAHRLPREVRKGR